MIAEKPQKYILKNYKLKAFLSCLFHDVYLLSNNRKEIIFYIVLLIEKKYEKELHFLDV